LIAAPIVYYAGLQMWKFLRIHDPTFSAKPFEQQKWIKGTIRDRGEMVQSLQDSKILSNLTKEQVCELLGPPDVNYPNRKFYYTVDVGRLIAGSMFPEQLYFIFDANERVVEYGRVD
jgi:outer membrane protein assembly factor BamE (lipoprotein component of BamABCDE complex)